MPPDEPIPVAETQPAPRPAVTALGPTRVTLGEATAGTARQAVMVALQADALWIQEAWRLRRIPLSTVCGTEALYQGQELVLTF